MEATLERPVDFTERQDDSDYYEELLPLDWHFIFESDIPPGPRILYAYIVSQSDPEDLDVGVRIPMEVLGRRLNVSYATVWKHCQKLEELGLLRIEQNRAGHNSYFPRHFWAVS